MLQSRTINQPLSSLIGSLFRFSRILQIVFRGQSFCAEENDCGFLSLIYQLEISNHLKHMYPPSPVSQLKNSFSFLFLLAFIFQLSHVTVSLRTEYFHLKYVAAVVVYTFSPLKDGLLRVLVWSFMMLTQTNQEKQFIIQPFLTMPFHLFKLELTFAAHIRIYYTFQKIVQNHKGFTENTNNLIK